MALKRVRTPRYITGHAGFGEGQAKAYGRRNSGGSGTDDRDAVFQRTATGRKNVREGRRGTGGVHQKDERLAAQEHPALLGAGDHRWHLASSFEDSEDVAASGDDYRAPSTPEGSPWQLSAFALLFSVVLLSALFLHLISDAQKGAHQRIRLKTATKKTRKKKTDEWSDDNDETLLSDRSHSHSADVEDHVVVRDHHGTSAVAAKQAYYPFHPPGHHPAGLQQHRHRKSSQVQHQQQPPPPPQAAFQGGRNYYLNQSGGAVVGSFKSGGAASSTTLAPRPIVGTTASTSPHAGPSGIDNSIQAPSVGTPQQQPSRLPTMYPQLLSSASSFDSSVEQAAQSYRQQQQSQRQSVQANQTAEQQPIISPAVTPTFAKTVQSSSVQSPKISSPSLSRPSLSRSSTHSSQQPQQQPSSHLLLSPGTDDVMSRMTKRLDMVEQTPRAGNLCATRLLTIPGADTSGSAAGGSIIPGADTAVGSSPQYPSEQPQQERSFDSISLTSDAFKFASPPVQKVIPESNEDDLDVPFIPSLDVHVAPENTPRPRSMNIDDLHLYQLESGNVSHWEARVAEEARRVETNAFLAGTTAQAEASAPAESAESSVSGVTDSSIPSNDPRKSIQHKRPDLTISTDASSSLQGAVDFSELRLVEVIGGGGFGQVWKAVWRGTPVAVKVLTGSAQSKNVPKAVLEEFVAEINLLKGTVWRHCSASNWIHPIYLTIMHVPLLLPLKVCATLTFVYTWAPLLTHRIER